MMVSPPRPRVLTYAYACEPGRGSEPGAGWGLVRAVAEFADVTVLAGDEHAAGLARWQREHGEPHIAIHVVPEPWWGTWARDHRVVRFVLYLVWLQRAHRVARRLHASRPFDAVHHATYSTYWLPTPAARLGPPFVWGPVGGAVVTPRALWRFLGPVGTAGQLLDWISVRLLEWWPATRSTWRRASARIMQNEETRQRLPEAARGAATILNHALFVDVPDLPVRPRGRRVLVTGRLEHRKGLRLALHALARAPGDVPLTIVGDGPERPMLERLARRLGIADRVEFAGWQPRARVLEMMSEAAAVLFTGLHEEGGIALAEALFTGTPVIVLANGGARTVALAASDPARVALVAPADAATTARDLADAMTRFSRSPATATTPMLDRGMAQEKLREAFEQAMTRFSALGHPLSATAHAERREPTAESLSIPHPSSWTGDAR